MSRHTVAHITHEAVEKMGGIGTVLEGLMTSSAYQRHVGRSILVGPLSGAHLDSPARALSANLDIRYSTADQIDLDGLARRFHPIEYAFGVRLVYGMRHYHAQDGAIDGHAEILLIDVTNPKPDPLAVFKNRLWKWFQLDSRLYEHDWSFEEYCRLAEPAFYALSAIIPDEHLPCIVISHEYMGMCAALKAAMDGAGAFRTIFHAHECSTARRIVEAHPGHDTAFYNIMRQARAQNKTITDIFGDQNSFLRHALITRAHHLDAIVAVGDPTRDEMSFLSPEMARADIDLVYNGIPTYDDDFDAKQAAREKLDDWAQSVVGRRPDLLFTHVARPVVSKGFWRDLKILAHLDDALNQRGLKGLYVLLTCGAPPRSENDVQRMADEYGWPAHHRTGYPDLVGPEVGLAQVIESFNKLQQNVQGLLVNQFGFARSTLGRAAAQDMSIATLRLAADVEFGQSVYEPFGIANFEPLGCGAICISSSVCGCVASSNAALNAMNLDPAQVPNVLVADYTQLDDNPERQLAQHNPKQSPIDDLLHFTQARRDAVEERVAREIVKQLLASLPTNDDQRRALFSRGIAIARNMNWDHVIENGLLPVFRRITTASQKQVGTPEARAQVAPRPGEH